MDFEIGRFTRRCAATGREFQPGDRFYSVLLPSDSTVERKDYLESAWEGAPEQAICWWKAEMPAANANRVTWAPHEAVLDYFLQLQQRPDAADQLYVLTLLMIRRRIFRLEETIRDASAGETMVVYCASHDSEYRIPVVEPDRHRISQIEQELTQLLFSSAA